MNRTENNEQINAGRRKALKIGTLAGVTGALAVAGINGSKSASAQSGSNIVSGSSLMDLLASLAQKQAIEQFRSMTFFHVPANSTVSINQTVPIGYLTIINEERIAIGQDHSLQMLVVIDDKEVLFDPDLVQARYATPLNYIQGGSFYPIRKSFNVTLVNKTSKARYFSSLQSGAKIAVSDWDTIVAPFLSRTF